MWPLGRQALKRWMAYRRWRTALKRLHLRLMALHYGDWGYEQRWWKKRDRFRHLCWTDLRSIERARFEDVWACGDPVLSPACTRLLKEVSAELAILTETERGDHDV
jgi:hypothetical protein